MKRLTLLTIVALIGLGGFTQTAVAHPSPKLVKVKAQRDKARFQLAIANRALDFYSTAFGTLNHQISFIPVPSTPRPDSAPSRCNGRRARTCEVYITQVAPWVEVGKAWHDTSALWNDLFTYSLRFP